MSDMPDGDGQSWISSVKDLIENASLARAGQSVTRLAIYALKTQHDEQFGREVKGCMLMYLERCNREVKQPAIPPDVRETLQDALAYLVGKTMLYPHDTKLVNEVKAALSWLDAQGE